MLSKFKIEFKKQTRLAITAAIGFIIAFAWKDYITATSQNWLSGFSALSGHVLLSSAVLLTLIGTILILIASWALE
jgi:hypothetical protein